MLLPYRREKHAKYLDGITKEGVYQDYENAIYDMNELKNKLREKGVDAHSVIDQADGIYYGDIMFPMPKDANESKLYFKAGRIIGELVNAGAIEPKINDSCLYFNEAMWAFMYTAVAIKADDGPDLYAQGTRNFVIR